MHNRNQPTFLQVFCTIDNGEQGRQIARAVVGSRLAGCAQLLPGVTSVYWWQGKVEEGAEWLLLLKTDSRRYPALERKIKTLHPYDCPEIIACPIVHGSADYLDWLATELDGA